MVWVVKENCLWFLNLFDFFFCLFIDEYATRIKEEKGTSSQDGDKTERNRMEQSILPHETNPSRSQDDFPLNQCSLIWAIKLNFLTAIAPTTTANTNFFPVCSNNLWCPTIYLKPEKLFWLHFWLLFSL